MPVVVDNPELQDAMMTKDPEKRKEAYAALINDLEGDDPILQKEMKEYLKEFEKAAMEHDLGEERKALPDEEMMEQAETE